MSKVTKVATILLARASSILCTRLATRSIANFLGTALAYCRLINPACRAIYIIHFAISLSSPLLIQESRAIGL